MEMARTIVIALLIALALGFLVLKRRGSVSSAEARRLVEAGARLVDVRTPEEFTAGHLPGAINLPVQDLERRMAELEGKERPLVLYCRSGFRSGNAARMLKKAGYAEVHDLGSMTRW
jgi:rhodanese-related sulfurtransferase